MNKCEPYRGGGPVEATGGKAPRSSRIVGNNWHILIIRLVRRPQLRVSRDGRIESIKIDLI